MGFVNYGTLRYKKHENQQPMNITWELNEPIPNFMWNDVVKLGVG
jgi:hypothetical protein